MIHIKRPCRISWRCSSIYYFQNIHGFNQYDPDKRKQTQLSLCWWFKSMYIIYCWMPMAQCNAMHMSNGYNKVTSQYSFYAIGKHLNAKEDKDSQYLSLQIVYFIDCNYWFQKANQDKDNTLSTCRFEYCIIMYCDWWLRISTFST